MIDIEQFNKYMAKYGLKFVAQEDLNGDIYEYNLYLNGEDIYLPDGYDVKSIHPEHIKDLELDND